MTLRSLSGVAALPDAASAERASVASKLAFPMSFAQQRLWLLEQLDPGTPLFNVAEGFRLEGPLDVTALRASINEIVHRHEALRTTFEDADGGGWHVSTRPGMKEEG